MAAMRPWGGRSGRKRWRCPTPHSGAVRNCSPPAPPWEPLSASVVPMWWISRSLNRAAGALPRLGVNCDPLVVSDGEWQTLQPMALKRLLPLLIDVAPPGVVAEGTGGPSSRMNMANDTVSLSVPTADVLKLV